MARRTLGDHKATHKTLMLKRLERFLTPAQADLRRESDGGPGNTLWRAALLLCYYRIMSHQQIDPESPVPLYHQIAQAIRAQMERAELRPGDALEPMRQAAERVARGENVSIMFGPERSGLENEDIAQANAIVNVPVNPDFPSLNLAQCVLLLGYEWRRATQAIQAETMEMAKTEWAETGEIEKLSEHFETTLDQAGFFFPEAKAEGMKTNLRNLWSRMPLTRSDVQIFHGMMRQMVRWKNRDRD